MKSTNRYLSKHERDYQIENTCIKHIRKLSETHASVNQLEIFENHLFSIGFDFELSGNKLKVTAMPSYPEPAMAGWIERAQRKALSRVVIKRRLKDPPLQPKPAWQLKGKTVRYDCYPGLAAASA